MIFMKTIKNFRNFNSVNEEFVPKQITKESRNSALLNLSATLDKSKLDLLNLLLLNIGAFYQVEYGGSLTAYNKETGANIFPTTATEVQKYYNELCKGFNVEQFQMLAEVLSSFAKDLRIDTQSIGAEAGRKLTAGRYAMQEEPVVAKRAGETMAKESYRNR